jgi:nitric oxide reductase NorD protein
MRAQLDGSEYDMDALVRAQIDFLATGQPSDRIYMQARADMRDLAVAVLIDVSRSTEAFVGERAVIEVEKEALIALSEGLAACQDDFALYAFSSLRRDRVWVATLKEFSEPAGAAVRSRIAALKPGYYTRLGGAIRHVSACLAKRDNTRRLLLVLSDGKPNDLDHYEGRYGIEDSRKAIQEARAQGQAVFGITVDKDASAYVPRIFGAGAYAIVSKPERLTNALPYLYRQVVRS